MLVAVLSYGQTMDTTVTPATMSVFAPDYYQNGVACAYTDSVDASGATATLTVAGTAYSVPVIQSGGAEITVNVDSILHGMTDGTPFSLSVSGVVPAENVTDYNVAPGFTANYAYYANMPEPTVAPASGSYVQSYAFNATFTYPVSVTADSIKFISGLYTSPNIHVIAGPATPTATVVAPVQQSYWDENTTPPTLSVIVMNSKVGGYSMPDAEAVYTNGTEPVHGGVPQYVGVRPDPATSSVSDIYGWWVDFLFTDEVQLASNAKATVTYVNADGQTSSQIFGADQIIADWDFDTNQYYVSVDVPMQGAISADSISSIRVVLRGVQYMSNDTVVPMPVYSAQYTGSVANSYIRSKSINKNVSRTNNNTYNVFGLAIDGPKGNHRGVNGIIISRGEKAIKK